ncbi:Protein of unknown function DUF229 domain containing protein [Aphelenchoides besseyi]|nr:Protein of unknown function DUF229 domain containing protein [Aphelenchoides besseyi]
MDSRTVFGVVLIASLIYAVYFYSITEMSSEHYLLPFQIETIEENHGISERNKGGSLSLGVIEVDGVDEKISTEKIAPSDYQCSLPHIDPWDPKMQSYFARKSNMNRDCKPLYPQRSRVFENGTLIVENAETGEQCYFRCHNLVTDSQINLEAWEEMDRGADDIWRSQPNCDTFEIKCEQQYGTLFKYMHNQIVKKAQRPDQVARKKPTDYPDLHIVVLDSVSMTHAHRALPKTFDFLRNEMGGLTLEYLNKVGINSQPNAYGFLLGERAEDLPANPWGRAVGGGRRMEICNKSLKDENYIGYDFSHYRSMINEDFGRTVFHGLSPMMLQIDNVQTANNPQPDLDFHNILLRKSCREKHRLVLENLQNMLNVYAKEPKFTLSWITMLAHSNMNNLYHADKDLYEFFSFNVKNFENSFLFFMADHGPSFGDLRITPTGRIEANNPFLLMTLPKHLRQNSDLISQLDVNRKLLISHYDLYATFLEIAQKSNEWTEQTEFSTTSFVPKNRTLLGSSLFHPLPQPRDCNSLGIPFQYCICTASNSAVNDSELAQRIAQKVVGRMNKELRIANYTHLCRHLYVDSSWKTEIYEFASSHKKSNGERFYKVVIRVLPRRAIHEAYVKVRNDKINFIIDKFPQLTAYEAHSMCIPKQFLQNYCYCRR